MKEEEESDQDKLDLEATEILREEQGTRRVLTDLFSVLLSLPRICAGQMRLHYPTDWIFMYIQKF